MATVDIRLRISQEIKSEAEIIFTQMGMTMSEAMRLFLSQCINTGGLPFRPHASIPNETTIASFEQVEKGESKLYSLEQFKDFLDQLK